MATQPNLDSYLALNLDFGHMTLEIYSEATQGQLQRSITVNLAFQSSFGRLGNHSHFGGAHDVAHPDFFTLRSTSCSACPILDLWPLGCGSLLFAVIDLCP